jgi:hypothetical protein
MASPVLEALHILYQRRWAQQKSAPHEANTETWLDPAHPLTPEELRELAETVYDLLRHELRIERERHRGF